ncbi:hypothetical protein Z517_11602 [Fonsecaea pedrosoi CBS 271.37]|uniref:4-coumarate-CoA ligase n=1 Tax=Fonsecaea pedrosoi CBS 271.37 TaxID=1442368 RepID=A0A0D2EK72_9EURO|nr:uncharacterized protein Z517_11602 [Fonsecaea pedrosoi CBS 271.37]KIW74832.1 hypothetical protein Z517_11602 [Fonsecaea pedrosoi CBS 271.37]
MPRESPFPALDIPKTNILSYLFPTGTNDDTVPLWISSDNEAPTLSTSQLLSLVKRVAAGFSALGIKPGDVVSVFTPNHIYVPVIYLATVGFGAIFTGFNPAYTVGELVHLLRDSEAKVIFVHPRLLSTAREAASQTGRLEPRLVLFPDGPVEARTQGYRDWWSYLESPAKASSWSWDNYGPNEAESRVATINYSSGTTGLPKGVMVTHANIIANIRQTIFIRYHLTPTKRATERWLGFLPLYHAYGQLYTILMACKLRIPVYVMESFELKRFLGAIQRFKISNLQIAPPILVMLDKRPEVREYDLSSVREVVCGAAPIPLELQTRISQRFGFKFTIGWGMTELTCTGTSIPGGMVENTGSVGFLLPGMEAKLVDEAGYEVATGERGEILIKGPNVCLGYWRNPGATKDLFDDQGWLKTGDVAVTNCEGLFWIVDRKKELIKVNGLQVAPAELEAKLLENEHVADVGVVGINLDDNEWPMAYVVLKDKSKQKTTPPSEIASWLATRVAKHKHLRGGVSFVDQIPKLASGKIQRKVLREWARREAQQRQTSQRMLAKI